MDEEVGFGGAAVVAFVCLPGLAALFLSLFRAEKESVHGMDRIEERGGARERGL
jgi:hypothetical protein